MSLFAKENRITGAQMLEAIRTAAERRDGFLRSAVEEAVNIRRMTEALSGATISEGITDGDILDILTMVQVPEGKERDDLIVDLRSVATKAAGTQIAGA